MGHNSMLPIISQLGFHDTLVLLFGATIGAVGCLTACLVPVTEWPTMAFHLQQ